MDDEGAEQVRAPTREAQCDDRTTRVADDVRRCETKCVQQSAEIIRILCKTALA